MDQKNLVLMAEEGDLIIKRANNGWLLVTMERNTSLQFYPVIEVFEDQKYGRDGVIMALSDMLHAAFGEYYQSAVKGGLVISFNNKNLGPDLGDVL